jgi:hypothetical protein
LELVQSHFRSIRIPLYLFLFQSQFHHLFQSQFRYLFQCRLFHCQFLQSLFLR